MQHLERTLIALSTAVCCLILLGWTLSFCLWVYGLANWNMSLLWHVQWSGENTSVILSAGDLTVFGKGRIQQDIGHGFSCIGQKPHFITIPLVVGESRTATGELTSSWRVTIPPPFLLAALGIPTILYRITRFEQQQMVNMRKPNILHAYVIMICIVLVWTAMIVPASTWRPFNSGEYQLAALLVAILLGWYGGTVGRYGVSLIGTLCLWLLPIVALQLLDSDKLVLRIFGRYDLAWYMLGILEDCAVFTVLFATAVHINTRIVWTRRAFRMATSFLCDDCNYNLTGNVSGICPECGMQIDPTMRFRIASQANRCDT